MDVVFNGGFLWFRDCTAIVRVEAGDFGSGVRASAALNAWRDAEVKAAVETARAEWAAVPPENREAVALLDKWKAEDSTPDAAHVHVARGILRTLVLRAEDDPPGGLSICVPPATVAALAPLLGKRVQSALIADPGNPTRGTWRIDAVED